MGRAAVRIQAVSDFSKVMPGRVSSVLRAFFLRRSKISGREPSRKRQSTHGSKGAWQVGEAAQARTLARSPQQQARHWRRMARTGGRVDFGASGADGWRNSCNGQADSVHCATRR